MKRHTKRVIYYTSVITALIVILISAVTINRTLVNTPEFNIEEISENAGEPIRAYMAYVGENDEVVIGIADRADDVSEIIGFVHGIDLGEPVEVPENEFNNLDAWVILYDKQNKIASRMNFYEDGLVIWHDGERYGGKPEYIETLKAYCDKFAPLDELEEETEETANTAEETDD